MMPGDELNQSELFSDVDDIGVVRLLLADLHDDLSGRVARFRYLADLDAGLGSSGTMLFGGIATHSAWVEARSSFVTGNFAATVLLCQSLAENLLAGFLHGGLMLDDLPPRVTFRDTLSRCVEKGLLTEQDRRDLEQLMAMRNPLSHFRSVDDAHNLDRRAMTSGLHPQELLRRDAVFAIGLAGRLLAKKPFRLG